MKDLKKKIKKIYRRFLIFFGFMCECGSKEFEEYGHKGYFRCKNCKK